ncbi:MAG: CRISPR-associated helicase Cas3' [Clostridia bacterium]|nr:CRISPR-associated helicase Cas3' [Clostridia bacterium]
MSKIYYAKSDTKETIKQHTDKLLENLKLLKQCYEDEILKVNNINKERFFYLLEIVCKYHDIGKVYTPFQNVILDKIGKKTLNTKFKYDIKHEQLSPMFVPIEKLQLSPEEKKLVYQAIYYHHEREYSEIPNNQLISEIIEEDIQPQIEEIKREMNFELNENLSPIYIRYVKNRIKQGDNLYNEYCLLKGLLHRLDHSSSALVPIEDDTTENITDYTEKSIINKGYNLNDLQVFTKKNSNKNILVIGSTGMGKTEAALLWNNKEKSFFTLPLRVSINAIYDRIKENINYNHVGLLHSTALDYLETKQEYENEEQLYEQTKNLSSKITTCTIDQIFPFVFKYKGYEKMYSTLAYSKLIIDEIQAYSPEIVAVILKGIQMINDIGGKFMIMTATLPRIYIEKLEEMGINFEYNKFIKTVQRHKIKIEEKEIDEDIEKIIKKSKNSKVLVIVNTVNKAIELYSKIKECDNNVKMNLLHSKFILNDRANKENHIKEFSKNRSETGIWITTQIVEASLDIDFDYLYTEMSTLDSLFQRLGRCYRSREYNDLIPNVYIYTKNVSGVGKRGVYNNKIHENSIILLKEYDDKILEENDKIILVDKLYSKQMLEGTEFLKDFESGMQILNNIVDYDVNKSDAQKLLRNIENITVIPKSIYDYNLDLFEDYERSNNIKEKNSIKREIIKLTTNISKAQANKVKERITPIPYLKDKGILMIDIRYDSERGLVFEETEEENYESREF